jgi:hypothetical protein
MIEPLTIRARSGGLADDTGEFARRHREADAVDRPNFSLISEERGAKVLYFEEWLHASINLSSAVARSEDGPFR